MIRHVIALLTKSFPLVVVILVVIQVVVTNELAASGQAATGIDTQIELLTNQNELMRQQVASSSSLLAISQKASEAGFTQPSAASYLPLGTDLPIALKEIR